MKAWREFELLVTQIESALLPHGAKVKSPDHIPDLITGQLREVDASIRLKAGSIPILITLECRDRNASGDATWIEQLGGKKNDIGAAVTIAVSSSGFSIPATIKAKHYGIELRTVTTLADADAKAWVEEAGITAEVREWRFIDVQLRLEHAPLDVELDEALLLQLEQSYYEAPLAIRKSDKHTISLGEIGGGFVQHGMYPPCGSIQAFGEVVLSGEPYFVQTKTGEFKLLSVKLEVEIEFVELNVPLKQVLEYGRIDQPIVRVSEHEIQRPNGPIKFGFIHAMESNTPP